MAKSPRNSGRRWTAAANTKLRQYARGNTPTRLIAHFMGRSTSSIYSQASKIKRSLKPVNQSPYGRRAKG